MKVLVTVKQGNSTIEEVSTLFRYCSQNRMPYSEINEHLQKNSIYTKRVNECKITIEKKE